MGELWRWGKGEGIEMSEVAIDFLSAGTYDPENNEICCQNCGSWTDFDRMIELEGYCDLCKIVD